ncbi:MAG: adenosylcobalamin-dependent ribonucleoside-diphosphate reductase [Verrucomicrobiota bacterium]
MNVLGNSTITSDHDSQVPNYVDEEQLRETLGEEGMRRIESRYLNRDSNGEINETAGTRFYKVARTVAEVESRYGTNSDEIEHLTRQFYNLMAALEFLPAGRILSNVSSSVVSLFNCYVLPVPDDLPGIYEQVRNAAIIHKSGGGTGYNFSDLRPRGMYVQKSQGVASGPVSFISQFDKETEIINSGNRRGANMGVLNITHPDILNFIHAKATEGKLANFNVSVGVTDSFMTAIRRYDYYTLEYPNGTPFTASSLQAICDNIEGNIGGADVGASPQPASLHIEGRQIIDTYEQQVIGRVSNDGNLELDAAMVFDRICTLAHSNGDPGMIFLDTIEEDNPLPGNGRIEATNPCGEQPLHPYDACNLGSVNLAQHVQYNGDYPQVNWSKIENTVKLAVQMLDNCNDLNEGPIPEIEDTVKQHRRIGLGVMGWADMLGLLEIPYDSEEALELAADVMKTITDTARQRSSELAQEKGSAPVVAEKGSANGNGKNADRNLQVTTIAPTGTISMVAGCNSGIEPYFAMAYSKHLRGGDTVDMVAGPLCEALSRHSIEFKTLHQKIRQNGGSVRGITDIPEDLQRAFPTAHEIAPEWHVKMQAAFQKNTDNAVSKTVNLPHDAGIKDVADVFFLAWDLGCKGVTIYRDGSKQIQVLQNSKAQPPKIQYKHIELPNRMVSRTPGALGMEHYEIKRQVEGDTLHVILEPKLFKKGSNEYVELVHALWQSVKPLGTERSAEFAQSGIDRSKGILQATDPDWAAFVHDLKAVVGDRSEGLGPNRIDSPSHAVGLCLEHALLSRGIIGYNERRELVNLVQKPDLEPVPPEEADRIYAQWIFSEKESTDEGEMLPLAGRNERRQFRCPECGNTDYHMEAGCPDPVCNQCGWSQGECG